MTAIEGASTAQVFNHHNDVTTDNVPDGESIAESLKENEGSSYQFTAPDGSEYSIKWEHGEFVLYDNDGSTPLPNNVSENNGFFQVDNLVSGESVFIDDTPVAGHVSVYSESDLPDLKSDDDLDPSTSYEERANNAVDQDRDVSRHDAKHTHKLSRDEYESLQDLAGTHKDLKVDDLVKLQEEGHITIDDDGKITITEDSDLSRAFDAIETDEHGDGDISVRDAKDDPHNLTEDEYKDLQDKAGTKKDLHASDLVKLQEQGDIHIENGQIKLGPAQPDTKEATSVTDPSDLDGLKYTETVSDLSVIEEETFFVSENGNIYNEENVQIGKTDGEIEKGIYSRVYGELTRDSYPVDSLTGEFDHTKFPAGDYTVYEDVIYKGHFEPASEALASPDEKIGPLSDSVENGILTIEPDENITAATDFNKTFSINGNDRLSATYNPETGFFEVQHSYSRLTTEMTPEQFEEFQNDLTTDNRREKFNEFGNENNNVYKTIRTPAEGVESFFPDGKVPFKPTGEPDFDRFPEGSYTVKNGIIFIPSEPTDLYLGHYPTDSIRAGTDMTTGEWSVEVINNNGEITTEFSKKDVSTEESDTVDNNNHNENLSKEADFNGKYNSTDQTGYSTVYSQTPPPTFVVTNSNGDEISLSPAQFDDFNNGLNSDNIESSFNNIKNNLSNLSVFEPGEIRQSYTDYYYRSPDGQSYYRYDPNTQQFQEIDIKTFQLRVGSEPLDPEDLLKPASEAGDIEHGHVYINKGGDGSSLAPGTYIRWGDNDTIYRHNAANETWEQVNPESGLPMNPPGIIIEHAELSFDFPTGAQFTLATHPGGEIISDPTGTYYISADSSTLYRYNHDGNQWEEVDPATGALEPSGKKLPGPNPPPGNNEAPDSRPVESLNSLDELDPGEYDVDNKTGIITDSQGIQYQFQGTFSENIDKVIIGPENGAYVPTKHASPSLSQYHFELDGKPYNSLVPIDINTGDVDLSRLPEGTYTVNTEGTVSDADGNKFYEGSNLPKGVYTNNLEGGVSEPKELIDSLTGLTSGDNPNSFYVDSDGYIIDSNDESIVGVLSDDLKSNILPGNYSVKDGQLIKTVDNIDYRIDLATGHIDLNSLPEGSYTVETNGIIERGGVEIGSISTSHSNGDYYSDGQKFGEKISEFTDLKDGEYTLNGNVLSSADGKNTYFLQRDEGVDFVDTNKDNVYTVDNGKVYRTITDEGVTTNYPVDPVTGNVDIASLPKGIYVVNGNELRTSRGDLIGGVAEDSPQIFGDGAIEVDATGSLSYTGFPPINSLSDLPPGTYRVNPYNGDIIKIGPDGKDMHRVSTYLGSDNIKNELTIRANPTGDPGSVSLERYTTERAEAEREWFPADANGQYDLSHADPGLYTKQGGILYVGDPKDKVIFGYADPNMADSVIEVKESSASTTENSWPKHTSEEMVSWWDDPNRTASERQWLIDGPPKWTQFIDKNDSGGLEVNDEEFDQLFKDYPENDRKEIKEFYTHILERGDVVGNRKFKSIQVIRDDSPERNNGNKIEDRPSNYDHPFYYK